MNPIRIGVIGTGNMGRNHVRSLSQMSEFELVGIYDADAKRAAGFSEEYGITAFVSPEALFEKVEAVTIAVPSSLHHQYTLRAAAAGRHVLVEKPIALTVADGREMDEACRKAGVTLLVGHVERYNPAIQELGKIVRDEEVLALDFRRLSPQNNRISDADVVQDLMIHDIDVLNALVDEPVESLQAQGRVVYSGKLDYAQAQIRYPSGKVASLTASRITEGKVRTCEVTALRAYITVDYISRLISISRKTNFKLNVGHDINYRQENIVEQVFVPINEPLKVEMAHFADCINGKAQPQTGGEKSIRALELCQRIVSQIEG